MNIQNSRLPCPSNACKQNEIKEKQRALAYFEEHGFSIQPVQTYLNYMNFEALAYFKQHGFSIQPVQTYLNYMNFEALAYFQEHDYLYSRLNVKKM